MLIPIIIQIKLKNKWSDEYANNVAFEYSRFLKLRSLNEQLSPSDDIDKLWHQHLLNTKNYYNYCFAKFNKFVHHDPTDSSDQQARQKRLANTIQIYVNTFGPINNKQIWNIQTEKISSISKPCEKQVSEKATIFKPRPWDKYDPNNLMKINVKIINVYDVTDTYGKSLGKKWKVNNNQHDNKFVVVYFDKYRTITVNDLKGIIDFNAGQTLLSIELYDKSKHDNLSNYQYNKNNIHLSDTTKLIDLISNNKLHLVAIMDGVVMAPYC